MSCLRQAVFVVLLCLVPSTLFLEGNYVAKYSNLLSKTKLGTVIGDSATSENVTCQDEVNGTCCGGWDVDTDSWWLHRPDWDVSSVNETGTCFRRMTNPEQIEFLNSVHEVQWQGNCSAAESASLISSGIGANIMHVGKPFYAAFEKRVPFQVTRHKEDWKWNYASFGNYSVCNSSDMMCYFLPISNCTVGLKELQYPPVVSWSELQINSIVWYMTRPQQWLRRRIYDFMDTRLNVPKLTTPCTVFHVRRTDIALDQDHRTYYRLSDYLNKSGTKEGDTILLLTDDHSAIDEAEYLHPNYNWIYVNRTRVRGVESQFQDHFPSHDPAEEMVTILSELTLATKCDKLAYTQSGFATLIYTSMKNSGKDVYRFAIDYGASKERKKVPEKKEAAQRFIDELNADIEAAKGASERH